VRRQERRNLPSEERRRGERRAGAGELQGQKGGRGGKESQLPLPPLRACGSVMSARGKTGSNPPPEGQGAGQGNGAERPAGGTGRGNREGKDTPAGAVFRRPGGRAGTPRDGVAIPDGAACRGQPGSCKPPWLGVG